MVSSKQTPQSWGRYPKVQARQVVPLLWRDSLPDLSSYHASVLPYGYGRSYGDSCLNEGGIVLDTSHLNRFIAFDEQSGVLCCEAGVSLADILDVMVPRGWFLPVSPGTQFVSVGGAIANDVHGKNHHRAGTFGCHVTRLKLLRSNGERLVCSPTENEQLFRATIGGLGLTGVILWAEIRLKPIVSPLIKMESIRYDSLAEFMQLSNESDQQFEYTVAWVDCLATGKATGRGLFLRGNHDETPYATSQRKRKLSLSVPIDMPSLLLNTLTMKAFNEVYYHAQLQRHIQKTVPYASFFHPLDVILHWNRLYGKRGFLQYQCVVPSKNGEAVINELLQRIAHSGEGSFLTVLKRFGVVPSPGMLSFPRPGLTLALDFPYNGRKTLQLFAQLDTIVRASSEEGKGEAAVYPAKDARMSAESFQAYYPQWEAFVPHIDPLFSSSFWRRVSEPITMAGSLHDEGTRKGMPLQ